jgi:hypothetical protein
MKQVREAVVKSAQEDSLIDRDFVYKLLRRFSPSQRPDAAIDWSKDSRDKFSIVPLTVRPEDIGGRNVLLLLDRGNKFSDLFKGQLESNGFSLVRIDIEEAHEDALRTAGQYKDKIAGILGPVSPRVMGFLNQTHYAWPAILQSLESRDSSLHQRFLGKIMAAGQKQIQIVAGEQGAPNYVIKLMNQILPQWGQATAKAETNAAMAVMDRLTVRPENIGGRDIILMFANGESLPVSLKTRLEYRFELIPIDVEKNVRVARRIAYQYRDRIAGMIGPYSIKAIDFVRNARINAPVILQTFQAKGSGAHKRVIDDITRSGITKIRLVAGEDGDPNYILRRINELLPIWWPAPDKVLLVGAEHTPELADQLKARGLQVITADDYQSAMEIAQKNKGRVAVVYLPYRDQMFEFIQRSRRAFFYVQTLQEFHSPLSRHILDKIKEFTAGPRGAQITLIDGQHPHEWYFLEDIDRFVARKEPAMPADAKSKGDAAMLTEQERNMLGSVTPLKAAEMGKLAKAYEKAPVDVPGTFELSVSMDGKFLTKVVNLWAQTHPSPEMTEAFRLISGSLYVSVNYKKHRDIISPWLQSLADRMQNELVSQAMTAKAERDHEQITPVGGIDLSTRGMDWKIGRDGRGVEMDVVDPAMIARIREHGLGSLSPVIFRITPVADVWSLVGLQK